MKESRLKVLLVGDNPSDALLVQVALSKITDVEPALHQVSTLKKAIGALQEQEFDVVLLDLGLPDSVGLQTFLSIHDLALEVPVIALTGLHDDRLALETMQAGAADYLVKDLTNTRSLERAMRYAIQRKKSENQRIELVREQNARIQAETLKREAEAANRAKDEFLATLSHELRTPLNAILGWATLLRTHQLDAATTEQAIETIERNARVQTRLIDDLLDVSRIIAGNLKLKMVPTELSDVVRAASDSLRLAIEAKNITVKFDLETPATVEADPARLQQVVSNMLTNAVKFSAADSIIEVSIRREESSIVLKIRDYGHGIDPAFLPHVFDRFRQADSTATRAHGGLGLGLAIVRNLVQLHGGLVEVQSDGLGCGATFSLLLPAFGEPNHTTASRTNAPSNNTIAHNAASLSATATRVESATEPATDSTMQLQGLKVLAVDDQADTRDLIYTTLSNCGAQVCAVDCSREALTKLEQWLPDVLISDVGMPDIDGYQLMTRIRALPASDGGQVPAIALTGYAGAEERERALSIGFQEFLSKPINPFDLVAIVKQLAKPAT